MKKFRHHRYYLKPKNLQSFRFPHVCCACRISYKYPALAKARLCPQCRQPMQMLSRKFAAPKAKDKNAWQVLQYLLEQGFRYYSVRQATANQGYHHVAYPKTMAAAREFVKLYGDQRASQSYPWHRACDCASSTE